MDPTLLVLSSRAEGDKHGYGMMQYIDAFAGAPLAPGRIKLAALDPPSLPVNAVYPDRFVFTLYGFGSGLGAAVVISIFRRVPAAVPFPAATA